ncbi:hypothetical protein Chor_005450 [Crotalus horridus]
MWSGHGGYDSNYGNYTQSPGGFTSPSATQGERKSRSRSQNIVPCTVSQLFSAEQVDDVFKVIIVGIIRHAEKAPTNILYKVDDMTAAPMDVRQWVDTDEEGSENVVVPPGTYVKVAGHLRSFQVLNLIKSCMTTEGISLHDLKSQLHNINLQTLKKAVEFLSSEGHIYSTIDDEHFKSTDAD